MASWIRKSARPSSELKLRSNPSPTAVAQFLTHGNSAVKLWPAQQCPSNNASEICSSFLIEYLSIVAPICVNILWIIATNLHVYMLESNGIFNHSYKIIPKNERTNVRYTMESQRIKWLWLLHIMSIFQIFDHLRNPCELTMEFGMLCMLMLF